MGRRTGMYCMVALAFAAAGWLLGRPAPAHWDVFESARVGAAPLRAGQGWVGECFLNIPDFAATNLQAAEHNVDGRSPDFTFKTDWIDFPAGPTGVDLDINFATVGEFFNDYIHDISDPSKLDEPFGNLLVRFRGYLRVTYEENNDELGILPVWVSVGCNGYDGFRVKIFDTQAGDVGYRLPIVDPTNSFYFEHFFFHATGLFPIQITAFNRYAPDGGPGFNRAGIEVYTYHGGLPWPAGQRLIHSRFGPATIIPPRVIYQTGDIQPLEHGDFDTDFDVDLRDALWLQSCFTGYADKETGGVTLQEGCEWMDFDEDGDVDVTDFGLFHARFQGP